MQKSFDSLAFVKLKTFFKVCSGADSTPSIPPAPVGQTAGWVAEYAAGMVYLCGGQDISLLKVKICL